MADMSYRVAAIDIHKKVLIVVVTSGDNEACLPGETEAFEKHCQGYLQAMAPVGQPEQLLVRNIAENYWRVV
jgi:hypothetical protein